MTPSHALFKELYSVLPIIGQTFDYLPEAGTKYPFIYIGEIYNREIPNSELLGEMTQIIHIYGLRTQRNQLEVWTAKVHNLLSSVKKIDGYRVALNDFDYRFIPDNTDVQPLLHYIINIRFKYNKE